MHQLTHNIKRNEIVDGAIVSVSNNIETDKSTWQQSSGFGKAVNILINYL